MKGIRKAEPRLMQALGMTAGGVGGAVIADRMLHDDMDKIVDQYNEFSTHYDQITTRMPRVGSAYEHIARQGPFGLLDGYGILEILKGKTKVSDYQNLTAEDYDANPMLRHAVAATTVAEKLTPEESRAIQYLFNKELELMGAERMAEYENPGTSFDSRTVVQASKAGEGTNPYVVGGGAGVGAGLVGLALAAPRNPETAMDKAVKQANKTVAVQNIASRVLGRPVKVR